MGDMAEADRLVRVARLTAEHLAAAISNGETLPALASPIPLVLGEVLHAEVEAEGWRFHAADVIFRVASALCTTRWIDRTAFGARPSPVRVAALRTHTSNDAENASSRSRSASPTTSWPAPVAREGQWCACRSRMRSDGASPAGSEPSVDEARAEARLVSHGRLAHRSISSPSHRGDHFLGVTHAGASLDPRRCSLPLAGFMT